MTRELVESVCIASAHPSLPGHFPGNPIVPGVVLLDCIAGVLERDDDARLAQIRAVKFLAPLKPDEIAELRIERDGTRVRFRIERDGAPILVGEGELA
jgi:3-hydroxyacyl-[acyl-carrier-protein] dehydratase